jgi:hypothetical protein
MENFTEDNLEHLETFLKRFVEIDDSTISISSSMGSQMCMKGDYAGYSINDLCRVYAIFTKKEIVYIHEDNYN